MRFSILLLMLAIGSRHLHAAGTLKFMTFNILNGAVGKQQDVINIIKNSGAEVVTVNEANNSDIFYEIADSLGYYRELSIHNTYNVGVLSAFPILNYVKYTSSTLSKSLLEVEIEPEPGKTVYVFTTHLYPFDTDNDRRYDEMCEILPIMADRHGYPVIFAGDLNSRSQLDGYSEDYGAVTQMIADSGYTDVYRTVHPDTAAFPGFTYNAHGIAETRIDYIFIRGDLSQDTSFVVDSSHYAAWPSDHYALYAEIILEDLTAPRLQSVSVAEDTRLSAVFSELMDTVSVEATGNYAVTDGISVLSAELQPDGKTVVLTTTPHVYGQVYTLTVQNVTDRADSANIIDPEHNSITYAYTDQSRDTVYINKDTYVSGEAPSNSYGSLTLLHLDGDQGVKIAYLQADLSGITPDPDEVIDSIIIYMTTGGGTYSGSQHGGNILAVEDTTWSENITWDSRPVISTDTLGAFGSVDRNTQYAVRLDKNLVPLGRSFAFALVNPTTDAAEYSSREGSFHPYIVLYRHARTDMPVVLASFTARQEAGSVVLEWTTETETANLGFNILRGASATGPFSRLNDELIPGHGTTADPHSYQYTDSTIMPGQYYYHLEQVDSNGRQSHSTVLPVEVTSTGIDSVPGDGSLPLRPDIQNPVVGPAGLSTYLKWFRFYDMKGNVLLPGAVRSNRIYIAEDVKSGRVQRVVVIKSGDGEKRDLSDRKE